MRDGWIYKKLGEVCEIVGGSTPKTNIAEYWEGDNMWVTPAELNGEKYLHQTTRVISDAAVKSAHLQLLPAGTVLLSSRAPIGKVAITTTPMYCNQGFKNAICSGAVKNDFVYWYLVYSKDALQALGTGATFKEISKKTVSEFSIPIPPISTQQQIVSELDLLSHILDQKHQQLKEYDALAESIFYDMFGDDSTFKKEKLVKITTKIGSGATPKGGNQAYKEDGISLIRSLNVHNAEFKYEDLAHIDEKQASELKNVTLEKNDVLFNITGASVTRCCIVPESVLPARVNQHVAILRPCKDVLNYIYLNYLLISSLYHDRLYSLSRSNGATREAITKSQLENFIIPLPPLPLQRQFAAKIESIEQQKQLLKESIKETEMLFQSRMDYWFNS